MKAISELIGVLLLLPAVQSKVWRYNLTVTSIWGDKGDILFPPAMS